MSELVTGRSPSLILGVVVVAAGFRVVTRFMRQVGGDTGTLRDRPAWQRQRPGEGRASDATGWRARGRRGRPHRRRGRARPRRTRPGREARRILDSARTEADGILERAHRQADSDAEQIPAPRPAGRRARDRHADRRGQGAGGRRRAPPAAPRRPRAAAGRGRRTPRRTGPPHRRRRGRTGRAGGWPWSAARPSSPPPPTAHRRELERIAGLTADAARAELIDTIEDQAKRDAALLVRDIEADARATAETRARARGGRGDPAGGQRADRGERRQRAAPALGRDEGPHHRSRGPQHPRVRVGDRRQPDHRRHPRGGAAVVLRPGAAGGRAAHAREARARRADPPAPHRGGLRRRPRRGRAPVPAGRRGRPGRGRHHRDAPRAGDRCSAGCATARRTGRTCSSTWWRPPTSPASWPPSCGWTSRWSSGARSCTTSARRSPTRSRAATRSSAPTSPASTARRTRWCTRSRRTTTRWRRRPSRPC